MKRILLFFAAALMSAGMFAATVTWNSSTLSSIDLNDGQSFTKDGVTLTDLGGLIDGLGGFWMGMSNDASFKFSTSLGNFTRIEITGNINKLGGSGWTQTSPGAVWTGDANETTFGMYFKNVSQIVFTIAEPTVAVTGVTLNQNEAQMTVGGETLTLTATVNPNNATDQSVSWSTSDANVATVENGVVTAVAAGNATITVTTTDGSFTATCAVTVTAPEPEPAGEVTVVFAANNKTVERTVTLPHTFKCNANSGMEEPDELDNIIYELYNGDYAQCNYYGVEASGSDQVEAGKDQYYNDYITIKGVFEGTATVTGSYYDGSYADHNYTLTISIKGDEPEPQPADQEITPNADPDHAGVYYSTFYDLANKYALPAGVEAYVATLDGANLLLSKIADAGQTIPADNAVILKSSVASFTLSISDAEAVSFNAINSLQGTDVSIATPANCYVLAGNDGVGFYHYTASMLNPHKAYVIYSGTPNQAPRRMPFIFDQATGIDNASAKFGGSEKILENGVLYIIKNGVKYNAMGQEVNQ